MTTEFIFRAVMCNQLANEFETGIYCFFKICSFTPRYILYNIW